MSENRELFYRCLYVYIIKRTLHGGLKIRILFSRGKNNILLAVLVRKILFWVGGDYSREAITLNISIKGG